MQGSRAISGGKHPCDTRLMYRPTDGAQSWGAHYMTAPASWLVYDALLDFCYEPDAGMLRLLPSLSGRVAVVHPWFWGQAETSAEGCLDLIVSRVFADKQLQGTACRFPWKRLGPRSMVRS